MRLSTSLALAALGLAASALPAAAGTLLVPSSKYPTIQKALNAAKPYDTVQVAPKTDGKPYSEALTISTPHVVLQGSNNPVIDGSRLGKVIHGFYNYTIFPNGIEIRADHVAVRGLTIQGFGFGDDANGPASAINVGTFVTDSSGFGGAEVSFSDVEISGNTLQKNYDGLTISGFNGPDPVFGGGTYLTGGYQVAGNTVAGNSDAGAVVSAASILVAGNKFTGNGGGGLDITGTGVTVSGNESGGNGGDGLAVTDAAYTYNPGVNDPKNPNPAPTITALNYVHDNGGVGIDADGTQTISGNVVANSTGYGVFLSDADFSTVLGNAITGTGPSGHTDDDGTGLYVQYGGGLDGEDSGLKVALNQISGSAGDGIYFYAVSGGVISLNNVSGSKGIGIHLSDFTYSYGFYGYAPTVVTQNRALYNTLFDARDDTSAPDYLAYNGGTYGDGAKTANVWTRNLFGTTDPVGLSK